MAARYTRALSGELAVEELQRSAVVSLVDIWYAQVSDELETLVYTGNPEM